MLMVKPPRGPVGGFVVSGEQMPKQKIETLRKRADFVAARGGRKVNRPGFLLQARRNGLEEMRVGFTCSKKLGDAVRRNRAKRRLREIARLTLPKHGAPGFDYVLIGKKDTTAELPFETLRADLETALGEIGGGRQ